MMYGTPRMVWGLKNVRASIRESFVVVFFACSVFLSHHPGAGGAALSDDVLNLLAFKRGTKCDSSAALSDWNEEDPNPCFWSGVQCDPVSLRVLSLKIDGRRVDPFRKGSAFACRSGVVNSSICNRVAACELSGTLSPAIWELSELQQLSITFGKLSGELPKEVAKLTSLRILDLRSNRFTGNLPSELGKLAELRVLKLNDNAFEGRIPAELLSCRRLILLSLIGNRLSGSIPSSLGNLPYLQELSLSSNRLTGPISRELVAGKCSLRRLDLSGNQLSGRIPPEIKSCSKLKWLLLNFNSLHGNVPSDLGQLSSLIALEVAGNSLSGVLPDQLGQCSKLEYLVLTSHRAWSSCLNRTEANNFYGPFPLGLSLRNLLVLWAPGTGLRGRFLVDQGDCVKLQPVNLEQNAFTGEPSSGLEICSNPRFLDLRSNAQFWQAPAASITTTNVNGFKNCGVNFRRSYRSYRFGPPAAGQTMGFEKLSGNGAWPSLRRSMLAPSYESDALTSTEGPSRSPVRMQKKLNSVLVAAIASGCAIVIVLFVLGLMFQCSKYRSPRRGPRPQPGRKTVVTFMNMINYNLSYDNVVKATGNFSIDNLIGGGGFGTTYKAEVKPGLLVAVKRLNIGRFQGVEQFETEIRTLGRIRHPNLVTLMGYHASHEEMFLIYNFFSRGNLETLIHNPKEEMDWKTRHKIALGIATALAFLHDDCVPRVLHRDIKPSNILLDDDMNAHLSDFGLARLLGASETHATTDVAGTFGYVAPEYAMTCRVTDKADVYSYGVVLLELLSGKRALDPSFSNYGNGFNIVSWACLFIRQGRARDIFTAKLWEEGPEKSLLETLKLAVLCTVDQLSVRPTMKQAVETLAKCRPSALSTTN